jgi:transcriptional regulator with XRE-family HTH domain
MHGSLALKLRVLRARKALTIERAAELAGVTPETISDAERGRRHPYVPTLRKLAKAYEVPVEELLEVEETSAPLADAPPAGPAGGEQPFPDVLEMDAEELEDLRVRAREDLSVFRALHMEHSIVADAVETFRNTKDKPPDMDELEARHRILRKLWKVVLFERQRPTVNEGPGRGPDAPIHEDTTGLSLDAAYRVWRGERIPASLGVR